MELVSLDSNGSASPIDDLAQTLPVEKLDNLTKAIFDWTEVGD